MRRIIERVVTVVTTTTWKISWEADPPQPDSAAEPASLQTSTLNISSSTPLRPTTAEAKEVNVSMTKDNHETNDE